MLSQQRHKRLIAAMAEAGIDELVLYGNAWQADYLRYAAGFGILEGHGIAVVSADGTTELYLDSASEAERAEIARLLALVPEIRPLIQRLIALATELDRRAKGGTASPRKRWRH